MNLPAVGRLAKLFVAAATVAGIGLVGTASGAGAVVERAPDSVAAAQPVTTDAAVSIAGAWTLTTDWGCDGSVTGSFSMTFNADGTFVSSSYSGRWFQVGDTAVWTYSTVSNLVYTGTMNGSWISGVQGYTNTSGLKGCFGGHLSSVSALTGAPTGAKAVAETGR